MRSKSEEILVEQAHDLYFYQGDCDKLVVLDENNKSKYVEALRIIIQ